MGHTRLDSSTLRQAFAYRVEWLASSRDSPRWVDIDHCWLVRPPILKAVCFWLKLVVATCSICLSSRHVWCRICWVGVVRWSRPRRSLGWEWRRWWSGCCGCCCRFWWRLWFGDFLQDARNRGWIRVYFEQIENDSIVEIEFTYI